MTTVTKQPPMERYEIHDEHGHWAGNICLRDYQRTGNDGKTLHGGEIMINSDYGAYANSWGNMGSPLKQFLCQIGRDYALNKLCDGKTEEFDFDASIKAVKKEIWRMRKDCEITRDDVREAMGELPCDDEGQDQFIRRIWDMDLFKDGDYPTYLVVERERPQITGFYKNVWIPFTNHLRTEIAHA
jgi:hypothetical protein